MIKTKENINTRKTPLAGIVELPFKNLFLITPKIDKVVVIAASKPIRYTGFIVLVNVPLYAPAQITLVK